MKRNTGFCNFCREYLWAILGVLSFIFIIFCNDDGNNTKLLNIAYSIFAAALFNLVLVFMPFRRRISLVKKLVNNDLSKLRECARLCRQSIVPAFSFEERDWNDAGEYVKQFCETNLHEVREKSDKRTITILQRIEHLRDEMKDTLDHLIVFREYLDMEQLELIIQIQSSELFKSPIDPIIFDIPEEDRVYKADNQKAIGQSIYEMYDSLRNYNQQKQ